jgi:hypothetical protein
MQCLVAEYAIRKEKANGSVLPGYLFIDDNVA